jgi:hypothetical protein
MAMAWLGAGRSIIPAGRGRTRDGGMGDIDRDLLIARPTPHARTHPATLAQYRVRMAVKSWPRLWPGIRVLDL